MLALVYKSQPRPKSEELPMPESPIFAAKKMTPWGETWLKVWELSGKRLHTIVAKWMKENRATKTTTKRKGLVRLYTMFWVCFTGSVVVVVSYAFTHPKDFPIEKHHHVYVWSQVKGTTDTWLMSGDGLPLTEWNCCPDFPCGTVIWPGYIAHTAKWEERGKCKSIRGNGLGFFWERDELGNVKEW